MNKQDLREAEILKKIATTKTVIAHKTKILAIKAFNCLFYHNSMIGTQFNLNGDNYIIVEDSINEIDQLLCYNRSKEEVVWVYVLCIKNFKGIDINTLFGNMIKK